MFVDTCAPSAASPAGPDAGDWFAAHHLSEVIRHMPGDRLCGLLADIMMYERGGALSEAIEDTFRRAECLAEAERIFARLETA